MWIHEWISKSALYFDKNNARGLQLHITRCAFTNPIMYRQIRYIFDLPLRPTQIQSSYQRYNASVGKYARITLGGSRVRLPT